MSSDTRMVAWNIKSGMIDKLIDNIDEAIVFAEYIVTGDKDLLILKSFEGIPVLNPISLSDILDRGKR